MPRDLTRAIPPGGAAAPIGVGGAPAPGQAGRRWQRAQRKGRERARGRATEPGKHEVVIGQAGGRRPAPAQFAAARGYDAPVAILRVATWNIFGGRARGGGPVDLDQAVATLRGLDADVVALQEVDRDQERSGRRDQALVLADALGMAWRFAPALFGPAAWDPVTRAPAWRPAEAGVADPGGAAYGIALLSRCPLGRLETVALPRSTRDEPRVAVVAEVLTAAGAVTVAGTHLSYLPGRNVVQLRFLQDRLAALVPPRLLAGDLNLWLPLVRAVSRPGWRPLVRGGTFPNRPPGMLGLTAQLDHVLVHGGGLRPRRSRIQAGAASDHRAVVVEVEVDPPAPPP